MNSQNIKALDSQHVMQTYARFDAVIERGEGARLYTPEGREYIDFTSGIGVNSVGYNNKKWAEAIYNQAQKLGHISNLFYTEPYARLAETLTARSGMKRVFFANSGAESNEGMIKLARKYRYELFGTYRTSNIITLKNSFHGRTIATLEATGQEKFHPEDYFPYTNGFKHVQAGHMEAVEYACADGHTCAVLLELIQGEGGVLPLPASYVKELRAFCDELDMLLLVDEVQTGIGRTGTLFAYQQYDIMPDAVSFAKGIAGGLPMGGFLVSEKCGDTLRAGDHGATFGGNPIAAAAALEVLAQIDDSLLAKISENGEYIRRTVSGWGFPAVRETRGLGLMIGVSIKGAQPKELAVRCIENGLLILTAGSDALRLLPPLTITREEIDAGLAILKKVLEEL
ncbi:MAG: aspartate aminotransferase family protein [Oscillospiraceae bacterium]|jgi:acetylornithine/N-succinyldiaminopimelate aminotransferase|nr:aspartate aminotransferase family protein [Oscillospiraceae bacterium]